MEASPAAQSRLIGAILVESNLITDEQLERALVLQAETGERLGEIVVAEFGVSRLELAGVLAEQWSGADKAREAAAAGPVLEIASIEPLTPAEVQIRRPIGEIFVELGFITQDQLEAALEVQRKTGAKLGEILVEQGSLSRLDLASALAEQWSPPKALRPPAPQPEARQTGVAASAPVEQQWSADDRAALVELGERLRVVELAAAGIPAEDDIRAINDLRSALGALEHRLDAGLARAQAVDVAAALEAVGARIDALESIASSVEPDALRRELEELRRRPAPVEGVEELRAVVERLEHRFARSDEITRLETELRALASRLDEVGALGGLKDDLGVVAGRADAAGSGLADLARRVDSLASLEGRVDEVAALVSDRDVVSELEGLRGRIDEVAGRLPGEGLAEELEGLRGRIDEVAGRLPGEGLAEELEGLRGRIDEVAGRLPGEGLAEELEGLRGRIDEVAGRLPGEGLAEELEGLRGRIDEVAGRLPGEGLAEELEGLRGRIDEVAGRLPGEDVIGKLIELAASARDGDSQGPHPDITFLGARVDQLSLRVDEEVASRDHSLAPKVALLSTRVDEVVAALPKINIEGLTSRIESLEEDGLAGSTALDRLAKQVGELGARTQERLDELAAREPDTPAIEELRARIEEVAAAVESRPGMESIDELRALLGELSAAVERRPETGVLDELRGRLEGLAAIVEREPDTAPLDEIRSRLDELGAAIQRNTQVDALEARIGELERGLATAATADELGEELRRVSESAAAERESLAHALHARVEEALGNVPRAEDLQGLRSRLEELAARPSEDAGLRSRVDELFGRLEGLASVEAAVAGLHDSLAGVEAARVGDALATGERLKALEAAIASLGGLEDRLREDVARTVAGSTDSLAERLDGAEARLRAVSLLEEKIEALAFEIGQKPGGDVLAGIVAELRAELAVLAARPTYEDLGDLIPALSQRIDETAHEGRERADAIAGELNGRFGALAEELDRRVDDLAGRADTFATRDEAAATVAEQGAWVRSELEALRGSIGEITIDLDARGHSLVSQLEAQRAETAALRTRLDELHDAAAQREARQAGFESLLDQRFDDLANRIATEVAGARADAEALTADTRGEMGSLGMRIDELLSLRQSDARALRNELTDGIVARFEERDADAIEAHEELRIELERITSSMGWRLERIEESLAADDSAALKAAVDELERRLEEQAAIGAEQVRVTERALRKGLASLGERLVDTEEAYADAGNALRRSIERLGAAVVEADARMAEQIPVAEGEGCVAFAPTSTGYRLVELPGKPPVVGSTVELEECSGPLVVTRYGRSPLPLDSRPCAYLDHA